jgi:hypothetical protein
MRSLHALTGALAAGLFLACAAGAIGAAPITPTRDDEVIEVLPASAGNRGEDRQLRKRLAARPDDVKLATAVARRYLEQARESAIRASPAWRWRRCAPGPTRTPRPTRCCSCARRSSSTCTSSMPRSRTCACCWRGRAASGNRRPG